MILEASLAIGIAYERLSLLLLFLFVKLITPNHLTQLK